MKNNSDLDFKSFEQANSKQTGNQLNYLNFIYQVFALPPDFIIGFQKFFSPEFMVIGDLIFYADQFDKAKYDEMCQQGMAKNAIQYRLNLILISDLFISLPGNEGIFENLIDMPLESARVFARNLADSWNAMIIQKFGEQYAVARYIYDEEYQEVYITLGDYK